MSHKPQKQIADAKRQPVTYDDDYTEQLWACVNSGQVEADQLVAHVQASEIEHKEQS